MITVRMKLIAMVVGCVTPAVVGAFLVSRTAERNLLAQVERRVDGANRRFEAELEEYQKNSRLALTFGDLSPRFQRSLAEGDPAGAVRFVDRLAEVYKYRLIAAADAKGVVQARGNVDRGSLDSLGPDTSPAFGELLTDKPLAGLIPLKLDGRATYALVSATPIHQEGKQVGALALVTPITDRYLTHLETKLNADLAISVNGQLLATTADHPAPQLKTGSEQGVLQEVGAQLFAVKTFTPAQLQSPGIAVELTASRDVTELRDEVRKNLRWHLGGLGIGLLFVLGFALRFAGRVGRTVQAITSAAEQVKNGKYVDAPVYDTNDELEDLAVHFNEMVHGLKERDQLRETFGRYMTRQVADHLMKGRQNLGGELVPVTVLFSDIRHFTTISENMDPRALLDFLNEYLSGMVESVMHHQGVVDKFIGDAIMAVFGAPVPEPDDPLRAVKAAMEMRSRLEKINEDFTSRGLPEIKTGIGLHCGQVVAGNMGHAERMEYHGDR